MYSVLTQLKANISITKMHWLAQGLKKVKFQVEPGDIISQFSHSVVSDSL